MGIVGSTFLFALLSAVVPIFNIELYLGGLSAATRPTHLVALSVAAGLGQTLGKLIWYAGAMRATESRWIRRRLEGAKHAATLERWRERAAGRPAYLALVVFVSASAGLPPLLVIAWIAGSLRMSWWVFTLTTFLGRTLRFWVLLAGLDLALS